MVQKTYTRWYTAARLALMAVALLSVANCVWVLVDKSFDFVATAAIPEILMMIEIALYADGAPLYLQLLFGAAVVALLVFYLLCGLLGKKRGGWMKAGCVFYIADYVFRLYLFVMDTYETARGNDLLMIVVRLLIPTALLVVIIMGLVAKKKLKA